MPNGNSSFETVKMCSTSKQGSIYQHRDEIRQTYEEIKARNAELRELVGYLENENIEFKRLYNEHKERVTHLNSFLEKSAKLFVELLDNTNSALQIGRLPLIASPLAQLRNANPQSDKNSKDEAQPNITPETAIGAGTRRKLPLRASQGQDQELHSPQRQIPTAAPRSVTHETATAPETRRRQPAQSQEVDSPPRQTRSAAAKAELLVATGVGSRRKQKASHVPGLEVISPQRPSHEIATGVGTRSRQQTSQEANSPRQTRTSKEGPKRNVTCRKIPMQRLDMQKLLKEMSGTEEEGEMEDSITIPSVQERFLSTIYEENLNRTKEVVIKLNRLSPAVVVEHLSKGNISVCNNSCLNTSEAFVPTIPEFSSTPNKFTVMTNLGLVPVNNTSPTCSKTPDPSGNFVTARKRDGNRNANSVSNGPGSSKMTEGSPKKEPQSSDESLLSPTIEKSSRESRKRTNSVPVASKSTKKRRPALTVEEPESTKRPSRAARPKALREASLRKKLRRT